MTKTETYARLHDAFTATARGAGIGPFDVRVLVALADAGGSALSDELAETLRVEGSAVRRAVCVLYGSGHAVGRGADGRRRRQGIRTRVSLTPAGYATVEDFCAAADMPVALTVAV